MEQTFAQEFVPLQWFDELADPGAWFDSLLSDQGQEWTQTPSDDSGTTDSISVDFGPVVLHDAGVSDTILVTLELILQDGAGAGDSIQKDQEKILQDTVTTTDSTLFSQINVADLVGTTDHATIEGPPSGFIGWGIALH